jgi:NAD(P)-dependent dehydrogenase (short-subunit alcohol dehydrogenase family)
MLLRPIRSSGTAVVTGGNSGIGAETVRVLVQTGMNVVLCLCARNVEAAQSVSSSSWSMAQLLPEKRERIHIECMHLSDFSSVRLATKAIIERYGGGGLDSIVNNAGIMSLPVAQTRDDRG